MAEVTIYHNPECGTSRNAFELITKENGEVVIDAKGKRV